ncbi:hypothetical protein ACVDG3_04885 [Meridianimarinicoccus sp. RP-17]|uniref:hypothetical protein n=1 Tax=Meridianimarinicoccus zhengii TaxID=2056810 RepID=UPI000DAC0D0B|nr:hypothetical protein [Phycocomes zhengii]
MKSLFLAAATACTLAGAAFADDHKADLVTVIASADAQSQLMGMVLTMQAVQQGATAHILLCGPAADIALKDAPASATAPQPPQGMSPRGLMQAIIEKTPTKAEVCAIYLPGKGLDASALIEGVTPAKPDEMAKRLLGENTRILSF